MPTNRAIAVLAATLSSVSIRLICQAPGRPDGVVTELAARQAKPRTSATPSGSPQTRCCKAEGRYREAIPFAEKALRIGEREFGPDHLNTAIFLNNLAEIYRAQGRYAEAEPFYARSLAIWEKALGPEHLDVATSLNNLAALYRVQGRYAEPEPVGGLDAP